MVCGCRVKEIALYACMHGDKVLISLQGILRVKLQSELFSECINMHSSRSIYYENDRLQ